MATQMQTDAMRDVADCFEQHRSRVLRWALALVRDDAEAQDLVQDVFLRMVRKPPHLHGVGPTLSWLRRVTVRLAIDRWRAAAVRIAGLRIDASDPTGATGLPDESLALREQADALRRAIVLLSDQQRLVLLCKVCDEMTFQQIADEIGVSASTAKTHYVRALTALRAALPASVAGDQR